MVEALEGVREGFSVNFCPMVIFTVPEAFSATFSGLTPAAGDEGWPFFT